MEPTMSRPFTQIFKGDHDKALEADHLARWIDEAIVMCRRAATDPVEFQRLGLWLQRIRRAV